MNKLLSAGLIAASLAFSGGAIADEGYEGKSGGKALYMQEALSKLPAEKAKAFRDTLTQAREQNKPQLAEIRKLRDEQRALIAAPKFDTAAYLAKSAEMDKIHATMRGNLSQAFANAIGKLSPEERKALAEGMERAKEKRRAKWEARKAEGSKAAAQ